MNLNSIRIKMLLVVMVAAILGFGATVAIVTLRASDMQQEASFAMVDELARRNGAEAKAYLEDAMGAARIMASTLKGMKLAGVAQRQAADGMLRQVLEDHPALVGAWTAWEPNAFDGKDGAHINKPGHDATGRYVPYWNRGSGRIGVEPLVDYDLSGAGDFYQLAKRTGKETILDPYTYPLGGKQVWITSLVVPIHIDGKFVGVAGVDVALSDLQDSIGRIKPLGTGYASLISHSGNYVADADANLTGKDIGNTAALSQVKAAIREGETLQLIEPESRFEGNGYRVYQAIQIGESTTPWSLLVSVPVDVVLAGVVTLRNLAILIGVISVLVLSAAIYAFLYKLVAAPLVEATKAAERVAEGDLTVQIETNSRDEVGQLLLSLKTMISKLSQVVTDVNSGAEALAGASEEVSATAQSLSQASSEQAAGVEETSASIEQMTASISQNAENSKVTDTIATKAAQEASEGGDAVKETVAAMKRIADQIGIIDDIAYQTNLLALNAAIEAARAGEHGKGFAVVAAEVRKLAERSQVAAREISQVAGSSVELAERAGQLLDQMVPNIKKTSDLVQEITAASEEQSSGVGQINAAIGQLSQITQQNASASEELAATAEEMSSQAEQLQQSMSFFRLSGEARRAGKPTTGTATRAASSIRSTQNTDGNPGDFVRF